jgi:hypothetical protein
MRQKILQWTSLGLKVRGLKKSWRKRKNDFGLGYIMNKSEKGNSIQRKGWI